MTLHIYYRHAPVRRLGSKARPESFSYAGCLENFASTLSGPLADGRAVLTLVFDGSTSEFAGDPLRATFDSLLAKHACSQVPPRVVHVSGGDQRKAWRACIALVSVDVDAGRVATDDHIYLLENDYLHVQGWFDKFEELRRSQIHWDYLTFYDHLDKYPELTDLPDARRYRRLKSRVFCAGSQHWRTTPSTCATYLLSRRTLLRDRRLLGLGVYDYKLFTLLVRCNGRVLLSPVPSLATHSMRDFLAPAIRWEWQ